MVVSNQRNADRLDLKILTPPSSKPPASTPNLPLKFKIDDWSQIKSAFQCLLEQTVKLFVHVLYGTIVHPCVGAFQITKEGKRKTETTTKFHNWMCKVSRRAIQK